MGGDDVKSGEVLEPEVKAGGESAVGDSYIALISQYTERPDLLIDCLEKNDPGFVARMNQKAEIRADKTADARFRFGGFQAYSSLIVSIIAAISVLGLLGFLVITGKITFWLVIAFGAFYAITQSGPSGFIELCKGVADLFRKGKGPE